MVVDVNKPSIANPFYGIAGVIFSPPIEGITYLEVVVGTTMYTFTRVLQRTPKRGRPTKDLVPTVVSLTFTCSSEVVDWGVPDMLVLMNDRFLRECCPNISKWVYKMYLVKYGCRSADPIAILSSDHTPPVTNALLSPGANWVRKFTEVTL